MKTQGPHQPVSLEVELQEPYHWWAVGGQSFGAWGLPQLPTLSLSYLLRPSWHSHEFSLTL